jgi:hypothetical protein
MELEWSRRGGSSSTESKVDRLISDSLSFPESSVTVAWAKVVFFLRLDFVCLSLEFLFGVSASSSY